MGLKQKLDKFTETELKKMIRQKLLHQRRRATIIRLHKEL